MVMEGGSIVHCVVILSSNIVQWECVGELCGGEREG